MGAEHGYCGCFSSCAWPSTSQCHDKCATHETHSYEDEMEETVDLAELESAEIFGGEVSVEVEVWDGPPGPRWCHCMRGPLSPDADSCDLWPYAVICGIEFLKRLFVKNKIKLCCATAK